jgi:hypothetical protein
LEAEGAFMDGREQYLLSALCQLYLWYLSSKGGSIDEMMVFFGEPVAVQMRKLTAEDKKQIEKKQAEKKEKQDKQFVQGLLALGESKGVKIRKVSKAEFYKESKDVL